jgi:hypothetical protein
MVKITKLIAIHFFTSYLTSFSCSDIHLALCIQGTFFFFIFSLGEGNMKFMFLIANHKTECSEVDGS